MIPLRTSLRSLKSLPPLAACARLASSCAAIAVRRVSNHRGAMLVRPLSQPLLFNQKYFQRSASSAPAPSDSLCWKCLAPLRAPQSIGKIGPDSLIAPLFFCASTTCGVIQPPSAETNLFDLFALPARFDLDPTMLDRRYKDAQRLIHPDKFHNKSEAEQAHSSAFASHLASANKTLKEPLSRAQYLLRTVGISVGEEGDTCSDPAFLMEMMELRETVDDLLQTLSANKADTPAAAADLARARVELKQCASQLQEHANGIHNELITAFHNGNSSLDIRSAAHPAPDTATARALVTRLLYLERVRAAILDRV